MNHDWNLQKHVSMLIDMNARMNESHVTVFVD